MFRTIYLRNYKTPDRSKYKLNKFVTQNILIKFWINSTQLFIDFTDL